MFRLIITAGLLVVGVLASGWTMDDHWSKIDYTARARLCSQWSKDARSYLTTSGMGEVGCGGMVLQGTQWIWPVATFFAGMLVVLIGMCLENLRKENSGGHPIMPTVVQTR